MDDERIKNRLELEMEMQALRQRDDFVRSFKFMFAIVIILSIALVVTFLISPGIPDDDDILNRFLNQTQTETGETGE